VPVVVDGHDDERGEPPIDNDVRRAPRKRRTSTNKMAKVTSIGAKYPKFRLSIAAMMPMV
jgi:hypothetical protein